VNVDDEQKRSLVRRILNSPELYSILIEEMVVQDKEARRAANAATKAAIRRYMKANPQRPITHNHIDIPF
jgi:hypothetical protein